MKQIKTLEHLKSEIGTIKGIQVVLLYGSFARKEGNPNSDIDIQILIDENFQSKDLIDLLNRKFENEILYINEVVLRDKIVVYFKDQPKIEFGMCKNIEDVNRNYLGSEVVNVDDTILFANSTWEKKINLYLKKIVEDDILQKTTSKTDKLIGDLIDKFTYEFENCSSMHRRSDALQFYFFYNIALHTAIQLNYISKGKTSYYFLPKQFVANVLTIDERKDFYDLKGTLFLPEANQQKRRLLDFFYSSVQTLVDNEKLKNLKCFCEFLYDQDFFWNFRDISMNNPLIKSGIIFRTATLTLFQNNPRFDDIFAKKQIKSIIDLRADREVEEEPYTNESEQKFNYIRTPFDPWDQPDWFKAKYHTGTKGDIAYRFFVMGCNDQIKIALEAILAQEEGAVAIHCYAGKDRTGIFISLLHLLVGAPQEVIYADYLASESDVKIHRLEMVLKIINDKGGIVPYLIDCELTKIQIDQVKRKLSHGL